MDAQKGNILPLWCDDLETDEVIMTQLDRIEAKLDKLLEAKKKKPRKKVEYTEDFERAWGYYPKRAGSNPKNQAFAAWNARIRPVYCADELITGIIAGTALNFFLGQYVPSISWLWWGPIGFCTTLSVSFIYSKISPSASPVSEDWTLKGILNKHPEKQSWLRDKRVYTLIIYTVVIIITSIIVSRVLHSIL